MLEKKGVLILVVVDDGLVQSGNSRLGILRCSLNPCCSGRWSSTESHLAHIIVHLSVLILVVVDDGLVLSSLWYQVS